MPAADAYNGIYRAQVVKPPAGFSGLWVVVPRLNGGAPMGPVDKIGAGPYFTIDGGGNFHGDKVLVGTIAGMKDDLVILGTLS